LPHVTGECTCQADWHLIYLPRRNRRRSWPWCWLYIETV